jgi:hypothetical protein
MLARRAAGKVTGEPDLQSTTGRISSSKLENCRSFLDICDLVGRLSESLWSKAPRGRV